MKIVGYATITSSILFSECSQSSASSYRSSSNTLAAAIIEVVTLLLDDKDIQHFISVALANQERYRVLKGVADLLKWLGRRLKNRSYSQIEKGLAELFSSRKRNFLIVDRLSQEIESRNPNGGKTNMDKLKLAAAETVGMPIVWWPLNQPRKYLPVGKVRIIWFCVGPPIHHGGPDAQT